MASRLTLKLLNDRIQQLQIVLAVMAVIIAIFMLITIIISVVMVQSIQKYRSISVNLAFYLIFFIRNILSHKKLILDCNMHSNMPI
jgi:hypothetical protein